MIVASIDIGTNTVLLLIAEVNLNTGKIIPIQNEYRMPRIGKGIKATGNIGEERLKLLFSVLEEFSGFIKSHNCEHIIITGTNAFRIANNTSAIIGEIKKKFDYDLNVISGEEEAEFAFLGAISGFDVVENSMVIDIGGSSTEIISGKSQKIITKKSLQLGSVSMTEQFLKHSPPLKSELNDLKKEVQEKLSTIELKDTPAQVIAIAGTATTLACMVSGFKVFDETLVNNYILKKDVLKNLVDELSGLKQEVILKKFGPVMNGREDIILAGAYILLQIMEIFRIQNVSVSSTGIRYGAIVKYLEQAQT